MKTQDFFRASLLVSSISLLAACGGGDGGEGGSSAAASRSGVLTDAAVEGVAYSTSPSGQSGVTTADGKYNFRTGDSVTFTLGGVRLTVPAIERVTPATIAAHLFAGDAAKIANATTNLAVLFQTLDADGNPDNGISVDDSIALTGFAPTTALAEDPDDFTTTLDDALPASVEPVSPQKAIKHYYGNELVGTWKAVSLKETIVYGGREETEVEDVSTDDDLGFLFSFDAAGHFIYSTWGLAVEDYDERDGDIAIGKVVYPESGTQVSMTGHASRRLVAGTAFSATDPTEEFLDPDNQVELKLVGNQLVITLLWQDDYDGDGYQDDITSVLKLDRLQNEKNSLIGSWTEMGSGENVLSSVNADGTVNFGEDVRGWFTYYVSNSTLVMVVLDKEEEGDGREQNGLVVMNYSRNGNTVTVGEIKYDGVSLDREEPVISRGFTFTHALAADGRALSYNYGDGDTGVLARALSRAELASFVSNAAPALAGGWEVLETTGSNTCGEEVGVTEAVIYDVSQIGVTITVQVAGNTYNGVLNGNSLSWSGSYPEDDGMVSQQTTLTVAADAESFSGSSSWTWAGMGESCSGTTSFTGTRLAK